MNSGDKHWQREGDEWKESHGNRLCVGAGCSVWCLPVRVSLTQQAYGLYIPEHLLENPSKCYKL